MPCDAMAFVCECARHIQVLFFTQSRQPQKQSHLITLPHVILILQAPVRRTADASSHLCHTNHLTGIVVVGVGAHRKL